MSIKAQSNIDTELDDITRYNPAIIETKWQARWEADGLEGYGGLLEELGAARD